MVNTKKAVKTQIKAFKQTSDKNFSDHKEKPFFLQGNSSNNQQECQKKCKNAQELGN